MRSFLPILEDGLVACARGSGISTGTQTVTQPLPWRSPKKNAKDYPHVYCMLLSQSMGNPASSSKSISWYVQTSFFFFFLFIMNITMPARSQSVTPRNTRLKACKYCHALRASTVQMDKIGPSVGVEKWLFRVVLGRQYWTFVERD